MTEPATATTEPATRLFCIVARSAPVAVVFRRGPTKQVQLLRWNLTNDSFVSGQWLKGRIYERRCDLSPSGDLLLYFAANYRKPYYSWTAISRPPYLTALALWPKGDIWGGGGVMNSERWMQLNHRDSEMSLAPDFKTPKNFRVSQWGEHPGWGEDYPIYEHRFQRDGWERLDVGDFKEMHSRGRHLAFEKKHETYSHFWRVNFVPK
ncbi:MAG: hypothetical protein AAF512_24685, partial [Pseudomonadota bacterium]